MRWTITFDESVASVRAARTALGPYLTEYNARAEADQKRRQPPRTGKKVAELVDQWIHPKSERSQSFARSLPTLSMLGSLRISTGIAGTDPSFRFYTILSGYMRRLA